MKTFLTAWLSAARGRFITLAIASVVGVISALLARWNFTLDPEDTKLVAGFVTGFVGWGIDALIIKVNSDGVKQIQDALPPYVKSDGVPGEVTITAVENLASK